MAGLDILGVGYSLVAIMIGLVLLYHYWKTVPKAVKFLFASIIPFGLILLLQVSLKLFSVFFLETVRVGFTLLFSGLLYLVLGAKKNLLPFFVPTVLMLLAFPYLPPWSVFGYVFLIFAIDYAYDLSRERIDLQFEKYHRKYPRAFLIPFSSIERSLLKRYSGRHAQSLLFGEYLAFEIVIAILIPALVAILLGQFWLFVIPAFGYFFVPIIWWMVKG